MFRGTARERCSTPSQLMTLNVPQGRESEHNWLDREKAIIRIRGMLKGGVHSRYPDAFFLGLKSGVLEKTVKGVSDAARTHLGRC